MTREEQIEKIINDDWNHLEGDCPDVAFRKGVNWADSNPNWHYVAEGDYPKSFGSPYLTVCRNKNKVGGIPLYDVAQWEGKWIGRTNWEDVVAWMELPQLPKFD